MILRPKKKSRMVAAEDGSWAYLISAESPIPVPLPALVCQPKALVAIQGYDMRGCQFQQR